MKTTPTLFAYFIFLCGFLGCDGLEARISQRHYNAENEQPELERKITQNECSVEKPQGDCIGFVKQLEKNLNLQSDCEKAYDVYIAHPRDPALKEDPYVVACLSK